MRAPAWLILLAAAAAEAAPPPDLRINQIQVVGTHNSYQLPPDPRVLAAMAPRLEALYREMQARMTPEMKARFLEEHPNPMANAFADGLDYLHPPLEAQLRAGARSLELDLHPDPEGGRYLDPLPYRELRAAGEADLPPLHADALRAPGLKVFHLADVDFRSLCPRFRDCLRILRNWSDANPGHSPVFVLLEPKTGGLDRAIPGATPVPPFDAAAFDEVEASLLAVLGRKRLITPDDVRQTAPTLEAGARAGNWPRLAEARGRFLFLFIVPGRNLALFAPYLAGRPSLEGRLAFVQGEPGMAHAAFVMVDNALARPGEIERLVNAGHLVRSRADIDTFEARTNDATRRDRALASGAQIVSTDYLLAPNIFGNGYQVAPFPGGFRCNPVAARCPAPEVPRRPGARPARERAR